MRILFWTASALLSGMVLSLLVAGWQLPHDASRDPDAGARYSDELLALQQELLSLRHQVAQLQAPGEVVPELNRTAVINNDTTDQPSTQIVESAGEEYANAIAAERERTAGTVRFLESSMINEPVDASWSGYAESEVNQVLDRMEYESASQLTAMNCQSTLCRIDARHQDSSAEMGFLMELGQLQSFRDGQAFSQRIENDDGTIDSVIFVSRTGYSLPPLLTN